MAGVEDALIKHERSHPYRSKLVWGLLILGWVIVIIQNISFVISSIRPYLIQYSHIEIIYVTGQEFPGSYVYIVNDGNKASGSFDFKLGTNTPNASKAYIGIVGINKTNPNYAYNLNISIDQAYAHITSAGFAKIVVPSIPAHKYYYFFVKPNYSYNISQVTSSDYCKSTLVVSSYHLVSDSLSAYGVEGFNFDNYGNCVIYSWMPIYLNLLKNSSTIGTYNITQNVSLYLNPNQSIDKTLFYLR